MGRLKDLTGKTFGRLTVIKDSGERKWGQVLWECECSCEGKNHILVCGGNLQTLHTQSCGCLGKEVSAILGKNRRKYNTYIEHDEYLEGFDTSGNSFLIDKEDLPKVEKYYWCFNKATNYWSTSWVENNHRISLKLHQVICPEADGIIYVPDHIDGNTSDNRKSKLRVITRRDNTINSGLQSNNASGYIGVNWSKTENKWRAVIAVDKKKQTTLGRFDNKEDAILCRLKAELKYYGKDIAPQRHLFKEYGVGVE